jgi:hypothetical protein
MARLMNSLTRLGIGIALVGGAANSMLYNGITLNINLICGLKFIKDNTLNV